MRAQANTLARGLPAARSSRSQPVLHDTAEDMLWRCSQQAPSRTHQSMSAVAAVTSNNAVQLHTACQCRSMQVPAICWPLVPHTSLLGVCISTYSKPAPSLHCSVES
jgi:hypothetical protein